MNSDWVGLLLVGLGVGLDYVGLKRVDRAKLDVHKVGVVLRIVVEFLDYPRFRLSIVACRREFVVV